MQAWARWYATADQNGYMKNDEAFLARLSRQMSHLPVEPRGTPKLVRAWKKKGDVSRCIPAFSEHLPRLFRFAEHVVKLATGCAFPSEGMAQIAFIATHLPALPRDAACEPEIADALAPDDAGVVRVPHVAEAEVAAEDFEAVDGIGAAVHEAGAVAGPLRADAVRRVVPVDTTGITAAAAAGINAQLAANVALLVQQVAVLVALLTAVAMSCATARAAFIAAWGGQDDKVGCLPQSVKDLDAAVRAPQPPRRASAAPLAHTAAPPAGPAAAAARVVADIGASVPGSNSRPVVPHGLSPHDAYLLVSVVVVCSLDMGHAMQPSTLYLRSVRVSCSIHPQAPTTPDWICTPRIRHIGQLVMPKLLVRCGVSTWRFMNSSLPSCAVPLVVPGLFVLLLMALFNMRLFRC